MFVLRSLTLILGAALLASCSWLPQVKLWEKAYDFEPGKLDLREMRRALVCGTPTEVPVVRLFDSVEALRAFDVDDRLHLAQLDLPADRSYILLEQGLRRTSGFSVELAKTAELSEDGVLRFSAEWLEPKPDRMVAQMLTSLCVLAAVDAMPYEKVEVVDRARGEGVVAQWVRD